MSSPTSFKQMRQLCDYLQIPQDTNYIKPVSSGTRSHELSFKQRQQLGLITVSPVQYTVKTEDNGAKAVPSSTKQQN